MGNDKPYGHSSSSIQGPAGPGTNGSVLFDLHRTRCVVPIGTNPGGCFFLGDLQLSEAQAAEVANEQWFVQVVPPTAPALFLEGRITVVPEPTVFALLLMELTVLGGLSRRAPRTRAQSPSTSRITKRPTTRRSSSDPFTTHRPTGAFRATRAGVSQDPFQSP